MRLSYLENAINARARIAYDSGEVPLLLWENEVQGRRSRRAARWRFRRDDQPD